MNQIYKAEASWSLTKHRKNVSRLRGTKLFKIIQLGTTLLSTGKSLSKLEFCTSNYTDQNISQNIALTLYRVVNARCFTCTYFYSQFYVNPLPLPYFDVKMTL